MLRKLRLRQKKWSFYIKKLALNHFLIRLLIATREGDKFSRILGVFESHAKIILQNICLSFSPKKINSQENFVEFAT